MQIDRKELLWGPQPVLPIPAGVGSVYFEADERREKALLFQGREGQPGQYSEELRL